MASVTPGTTVSSTTTVDATALNAGFLPTVALDTNENLTTTDKLGYRTGAGGTVTQGTSKSTGVTLSKMCGQITMHAATLAAGTVVSFTVTNTLVVAGDRVVCGHDSGGTVGSYTINAGVCSSGSYPIYVRNNTAGDLSEAVVVGFHVVKGVTA